MYKIKIMTNSINNIRYNQYSSIDGGYCVYSVYGEDSNCDMGGSHVNPFLGTVEGTFNDVIKYAADNMKSFYAWGGGGYIKPFAIENICLLNTVVLDKKKNIKNERKAKLKKLVKANIDTLIESIDTMTIEEIKQSLIDIKENF